MKIKYRITWGLFILIGFVILIINNSKNIIYFPKFIAELKELFKKHSKYIEDGDYRIIKKRKR